MHSESFMGPKTLQVLRNIPKPLCRYWWNGIFQNSYAWKWIDFVLDVLEMKYWEVSTAWEPSSIFLSGECSIRNDDHCG